MRLTSTSVLAIVASFTTLSCGRSLEPGIDGSQGGGPNVVVSVGPGPGSGSAQGGSDTTGPTGAGGTGPTGPSGTGGASTGEGGHDTGAGGDGSVGSGGEGPGSGAGGEGPGSGAGGGDPVCASFGDPCTSCVADACPDRWCACVENPACLELFACTSECNSQPCLDACYVEHADGVSDAGLVLDCAGGECPAACPGAEELPDCTECLYESCADETDACSGEPECFALYDCLVGCNGSDLACQAACYEDHEDGIDPLQDLFECSEVECPDDCN